MYLSCSLLNEDVSYHRSYEHYLNSRENEALKKLGLSRTHDFCDTGAVLITTRTTYMFIVMYISASPFGGL